MCLRTKYAHKTNKLMAIGVMRHKTVVKRLQTIKKGVSIALLTMFSMGLYAYAYDEPSEEQVKAAFIFNFAKFVEWPNTSFDNENYLPRTKYSRVRTERFYLRVRAFLNLFRFPLSHK